MCRVDLGNDPYKLSCIELRLGGFQLLMSDLRAVGFIMEGSGLREAFFEIYAENSADKECMRIQELSEGTVLYSLL